MTAKERDEIMRAVLAGPASDDWQRIMTNLIAQRPAAK